MTLASTTPKAPDAARFFDAIAGRYEREYALSASESRTRMARILAELPASPPGARIVDLGVGTGRELTAFLDAGHRPVGVDFSIAMLARCARRARPVPTVLADFWRPPLPFDDASFDAAVALHGTLAHPPHDDAARGLARELARIVRSGGVFLAEVPTPAWLDRVSDAPAHPDRPVRRTGPRTCIYEDRVAGASIATRVLDESEWRAAFEPSWNVRFDDAGDFEWRIVATRRASVSGAR